VQVYHILPHANEQFGRGLSADSPSDKAMLIEELRSYFVPYLCDTVSEEDHFDFVFCVEQFGVLLRVGVEPRPVLACLCSQRVRQHK